MLLWRDSFLISLLSLNSIAFVTPSTRQQFRRSSSLAAFNSVQPLLETVQDLDPKVAATVALMPAFFLLLSTRPPAKLVSDATLAGIVEGTFLANKPLACVYKASRDGWSAVDFHEAVDGRGSGVVVARSLTGAVFGGFNPNGWRSTDDYYSSSAAFLWTTKGSSVVKLPVLVGGNAAVFDYATAGPCFGAADLLIGPPAAAVMGGFAGPDMEDISASAASLRRGKSATGSGYDWNDAWPARGSFQLLEVEVYCSDKFL